MEKRDPYNNKKRWESWKEKYANEIPDILKRNSKFILDYLNDMELGKNTSQMARKGPRSYIRLVSIKDKMMFFSKHFKKSFDKLNEDDVHIFFNDMRTGKMKREDGKVYKSTGMFVKDFKAFWNWMRRTKRVDRDITEYLSRMEEKPAWVYVTETEFRKYANNSNAKYRALIWFMYDAGLRVTEAYSIKIKDFSDNFTKLTIRNDVSKTFGRKIKLMLCSKLIKEYVEVNNLLDEDYLFTKKIGNIKKPIKPPAFNKYLKELAEKLFGCGESPAREYYNKFTLYDIRHNSSCYWLKKYPGPRGVMYRLGWKKEEEINYYSEFLGLSDEITDEDMFTAEDKTKLEKEIEKLKQQNQYLADGLKVVRQKIFLIEQSPDIRKIIINNE